MKKLLLLLLCVPLIGLGQSIEKPTDWYNYQPTLVGELYRYSKEKNFKGPSIILSRFDGGGDISYVKEIYNDIVIPATAKLENGNGIIKQYPKEIILNGKKSFYFIIEWNYSSYVVRRSYYTIPFSEYLLQICFMDLSFDNCEEIFQRTLKTIKF